MNRSTGWWWIIIGLASGTLAGLVLGFLLKGLQEWTGLAVYTLLLNVDFIPLLNRPLPEWFEFVLHMAVSVPLGAVFGLCVRRWAAEPNPAIKRRIWGLGLLFGLLPSTTFFILTPLSERTPDVTDLAALLVWIGAHMVYGLCLAGTFRVIEQLQGLK